MEWLVIKLHKKIYKNLQKAIKVATTLLKSLKIKNNNERIFGINVFIKTVK